MTVSMTWPQYLRKECTVTIELSRTETEILSVLLMAGERPLTCHEIIERVYPDPDTQPDTALKALHVYIHRLRRKLGKDTICYEKARAGWYLAQKRRSPRPRRA
jgi:DNA-binding response OmpR family regulator